jgi:hypothetical protein
MDNDLDVHDIWEICHGLVDAGLAQVDIEKDASGYFCPCCCRQTFKADGRTIFIVGPGPEILALDMGAIGSLLGR